jgi:ABC-type uncharacterized transport system permease subunit
MNETLKSKKAEETFSAALVVVLLLILLMWGGVAILFGSAIGIVAYAVLFRQQLHSRGWLKAFVIPVTIAAAVGTAIAVALSRGHWH